MATYPLLLSFCACLAAPPPAPPAAPARPADSVVKVIASVRYPNPLRPWLPSRPMEVSGSGVVIGGNRVLTSAHLVLYATEVHLQSRPGADKVEAKVESAGPDVDLAVLTVADKKFFARHPALPRTRKLPSVRDTAEVYGFPVGGDELSVTRGAVSRVGYDSYSSRTFGLVVQVSAAINPGNSGGPAVVGGKMVGLVTGRLEGAENIGCVLPNEEIDLFLKGIKVGRYEGKLTDATWTRYQALENDSLRALLKLDRRTKGILLFPRGGPGPGNPFREFDVLTRVGGYDVDNKGMVRLPGGLRVPFVGLIPRLARDNKVPVTVLRDGKRLRLELPVSARDPRVVREFRGEQPSYFIHGPLVFSPAMEEAIPAYLRLNPSLYAGSPLLTRRSDRARFEGEELVVVTAPMFEHKVGKGYDDPVGQVLAEVNGTKVRSLRHLVELLRDCTDEFLKLRFAEEHADLLVFRRADMERATHEVMEDNGIPPTRRGSKDMLAVWNRKPARSPRPAGGK
jgi:S1-C subfamily serine protease